MSAKSQAILFELSHIVRYLALICIDDITSVLWISCVEPSIAYKSTRWIFSIFPFIISLLLMVLGVRFIQYWILWSPEHTKFALYYFVYHPVWLKCYRVSGLCHIECTDQISARYHSFFHSLLSLWFWVLTLTLTLHKSSRSIILFVSTCYTNCPYEFDSIVANQKSGCIKNKIP